MNRPPSLAPLPVGFSITVDADTRQIDESTLFGGSPARVLRLSAAGRAAWAELTSGPVSSPAGGVLARRLTDAGLAHAAPPMNPGPLDVCVVIPVRDRPALLAQCLTAVGRHGPVLVIDDASHDFRAIAEVVERHGATLLRTERNLGPAGARNLALAQVATEFVAFLDSDCTPPSEWIQRLAAHLGDPTVAVVAPRIVAAAGPSSAARYGAACGSLDLGPRAALVAPGTRVAYVPSAALLVRTAALRAIGTGDQPGGGFDAALRYGEDVDLIWRLHRAGWRIRYAPDVEVMHAEPSSWRPLLVRRFRYGTSAAPLALRHPEALAPLVVPPWPALTVGAAVLGFPTAALAFGGAGLLIMRRRLVDAGLPARTSLAAMGRATHQTWLGAGRYGTQFAAPVLAAALLTTPHSHPLRRLGIASLLLGPPLSRWRLRRPELDPVRFTLGHLADDLAYGAGVYAGCRHHRTTRPLRPVISRRPLRGAITTRKVPQHG